ncbi:MAG: DUF1727 domain-containing protein [Candidatus Latescibacteria bacterium]|jgi:lipid II isoglutaminyl synthase (glutamine-hydrolysing)|nr:DUF1727 domain-containing protein [Candidatus Latescibacterota bacterium]
MSENLIHRAAMTLDKSVSRLAEIFEMTRGRVPRGSLIAALFPEITLGLLEQIREGIVYISGSNGKTTTSRMLANILIAAEHPTLCTSNTSGTLEDISTALIHSATARGQIRSDYGVFGVDDETILDMMDVSAPLVVVLNNLYQDGVETEGGADAVIREWRSRFKSMEPGQVLVVNADDPVLCGGFVRESPPRILYFGVEDKAVRTRSRQAELTRCYKCGAPLEYEMVGMSHLGDYRCDVCGWKRPAPSVYAINVVLNADGSSFRVITPSGPLDVALKFPGVHNIYNAVAAAAAADCLGILPATIRTGLERTIPETGRCEPLTVNERHTRLMLVKNPTSLDEAIRTAFLLPPPHRFLFLVDNEVDTGGDVSWIWDANLERLSGRAESVVVSGSGAEHLVLRFKHAGVDVTEVDLDPDYAFHRAMADTPRKGHLHVLATESAMFELRQELADAGLVAVSDA